MKFYSPTVTGSLYADNYFGTGSGIVNVQSASYAVSASYVYGITSRFNTQTGTSYTMSLSDSDLTILMNSSNTMSLFVPTNASVPFVIGTTTDVCRYGSGPLNISSSATIRSADGYTKLRVQYSTATLQKINTDEWLLIGDLSA